MKQRQLMRIVSFILAFIIVLELGPMQVLATENGMIPDSASITVAAETAPAATEPETPEVYIEGEVTELRSEYGKHYRLTDGSFMAVQYQVPVHYTQDGQWVDIDNTLQAVTMFSGESVYQAVNGDNVQAFASELSDGTIMTMANSNHMISMSIWSDASTETEILEGQITWEVENAFAADGDGAAMSALTDGTEDAAAAEVDQAPQEEVSIAQVLTVENTDDALTDTMETEPRSLDDVVPNTLSSSVLYENVFPGVDLRYDTFSYNVKESIILKQKMDLDEYAYSFLLTLDGLEPELQEDGSILLLDDENEVPYTIPAPYMWDAGNAYSDAAYYELEETAEGWILTVCADEIWLEDEERVYPVTIDPSINITTDIRYTTSVQTGTPNSGSGPAKPGRMSCGYSTTFGNMQGYVQLTALPELPVGSTVISAKLRPNSASHWLDVDCRMDVYMLTSAVTESYWEGIIPWNQQPASEALAMDFIIASEDTTGYFAPTSWDITPAFMQWMKDPQTNYGLKLVGVPSGSGKSSWCRFDSPQSYMTVTYRNTVGTESYYTYETQSAVRAGTGYVGDFSSTLTVFKNDVSYSSTTIPFSVSHVYNSSLGGKELNDFTDKEAVLVPGYASMKTGNGWQLSIQESVVQISANGLNYQVYRDGDGTLHYFHWLKESTYIDEDGLGLTLRQYADGGDKAKSYEIKDQSGNIRFFRNNVLSYLADGNGNRIYFLYNNNGYSETSDKWHPEGENDQLTGIVAVNKGQTATTICTFNYIGNRLSSITDYAGRVTEYGYDEAGNLTEIKHPDGTTAQYTYDSAGNLIGMYDAEAGYGIEYGYDGNSVSSIQEYSIEKESNEKIIGVKVLRSKASIQEAIYRYDGNDRQFNTEDDIVNCFAFDYAGRTINAVTLNNEKDEILGVTAAAYISTSSTTDAANNRIEKSGQSGQNGVNLLRSGGLERHNSYTPASSDWKKNTAYNLYDSAIKNTQDENDTGEARTGFGYLKTWIGYDSVINTSDDHRRIAMYQEVYLEAQNTYTISAYVNTQGIQQFDQGGAYVAIMNGNNEILSEGNVITYSTAEEIENGWQRVYATFDCDVSATYRIAAVQEDAYGHCYFDDLQLERGNTPSTVNLLQNGTFGYTSEWTVNNFVYDNNDDVDNLHPDVLCAEGDPENDVRAVQRVQIGKVCTDQTFLLSGWGKAASAAGCKTEFDWTETDDMDGNHGKRYFGLIAKCTYTDADGTEHTDYHFMPFDDEYDNWQFASCIIVPDKEFQSEEMILEYIDVYIAYDNNFNTMYVDNLSLRQEPCTTYTYNENGDVRAVNAAGNDEDTYEYSDDGDYKLMSSYSLASGHRDYEYEDDNNRFLVTSVFNKNTGVDTDYEYDKLGNVIKTVIDTEKIEGSDEEDNDLYIESTSEYYIDTVEDLLHSDDGSLLKSTTNGNGQKTTYEYDEYRDLVKTTDAKGTSVVSLEESLSDRARISYISGVVSVDYGYSNGLLHRITRGGYLPDDTHLSDKQNQFYNMSYDTFGNMTQVSIGEDAENARVLASYDYGGQNGHLNSMTYGNGDSIAYTYDELDRLTVETWDDGTAYEYFYNSEGALAKKVDTDTGNAVNYEYDSLGRLIHSSMTDSDGISMLTEHLYDRANRIKEQSWQLRNDDDTYTTYTEEYEYRDSDGSIVEITPAIGNLVTFAYDDLARLSNQTNDVYSKTYSYRNISSTQTTAQIKNVAYAADGSTFKPFSLEYTYDAVGNIASVAGTDITTQDAVYGYDIQGQLISETVGGVEYKYVYDTYGNIRQTSKVVDGVETVLHTYTYGDSDWKDLLTEFDGHKISYDAIGNPRSYHNGSVWWSMSWEHGRQLAYAFSDTIFIEYTYDMAGIRDSKDVAGTVYNYLTLGGKVMRQTWTKNGVDHVIDFAYDNAGSPYAFTYDGTTYYYVLNQQGDVIRIVNANGAAVAEYQYNAWGKLMTSEAELTAIGKVNPLRYRGYYYDAETGFYYLQSRYYDPSIGRFINADAFASTGQGFLGYNMFAYCGNNPVNCIDESGTALIWVYIKQLVLWGFIHYCVQDHICNDKNNGDILKELWLTKNGKLCGRADLMNKDGEVWEVKHAGKNPMSRMLKASLQAISYKGCKALRTNTYITGLGKPNAFSGEFVINYGEESYLVNYTTPTWGVVLYAVAQIKYQENYDYYLGRKKKEADNPVFGMPMVPIIIVPDFSGCFPLTKEEYGFT